MPGVDGGNGMRVLRLGIANLNISFGKVSIADIAVRSSQKSQRKFSLATRGYSSTIHEGLTAGPVG